MYGIVTRNQSELEWDPFDQGFYEVKDVTGRAAEPVDGAVNMVSCFADNAAEDEDGLVPVAEDGTRATREQPYFDWSYVCPTHDRYREGLLEIVDEAAAANEDVRLDDVGFPRAEYCYCDRCQRRFEDSGYDDWGAWRESVITEFIAAVRERVPGKLYLTVYPDPYPGHLSARSGIDLDALSTHVDQFVVPIYDTHYGTTYWLEILASGFADRLSTPFAIELYAASVEIDELIHAAEVADEYADDVLFGYDASTARAALRRMTGDANGGDSYAPEDADH